MFDLDRRGNQIRVSDVFSKQDECVPSSLDVAFGLLRGEYMLTPWSQLTHLACVTFLLLGSRRRHIGSPIGRGLLARV